VHQLNRPAEIPGQPVELAGAAQHGQADQPSPAPEPAAHVPARSGYSRSRVVRRRLGLAGFAFSVTFFCLSQTPSMLPRSPILQGAVSGVTAAIGYGLGATLGALVRRFRWWQPDPWAARIVWRVLFVVAPLVGLLFLALGTGWQQELRERLDMGRMQTYDIVRIVGIAVLVFALILLVARLLRLATRALARLLGRIVPKPVAYGVGFLVVGYLCVGFVEDFLISNVVTVANQTASLANGRTSPGITAPTSAELSGSPASLVAWDSLGQKGRDFVGTAPTSEELGAFAGTQADDPIRVYVGLDSAGTVEQRAELAVREMERTGAFDRAVVAVIITTGTGWVDPDVAESLEHMYAGDTALVSMQYSYLPSWLSFMVDKSKATDAASALIGAVHAEWEALPAESRPKLVLFGESLGSYGTETTFGDLDSMAAGADGVLLVGPPFANPIWSELVEGRDEGTPVWNPVYDDGSAVLFVQDSSELRSRTGSDDVPTVMYLQNSSDPVVWWNPQLLYRAPEWLDEPRGPDISPDMSWYPGVTFWQTVVDLAFSTTVPTGHGHVYGSSVADAWAALVQPPDWTTADTERLRALLDTR
jgi:uncharacterized membrane protein